MTPNPARNNYDLAAMHAALVGVSDPEFVELEAKLRSAQLGADIETLDALTADTLLFTGPGRRSPDPRPNL